MAEIAINSEKCTLCNICLGACPFAAIEALDGKMTINAACKFCKACVDICPFQAIAIKETVTSAVDLSLWHDILIFAEVTKATIHPVVYELIGKALELQKNYPGNLHCVLIGSEVLSCAKSLQGYGLKQILVFQDANFRYFTADAYAKVFAAAIDSIKPAIVLIGATPSGRSLAPRLATRFRSGLTADCTALKIQENGNLIQIRPAFGGDIMAQILTSHTRPQFATVRYKTMERAVYRGDNSGDIIIETTPVPALTMEVLKEIPKPATTNIADAEIIVAAGKGLKNVKDLEMLEELATRLQGQLAGSRPLIEKGWLPYTKQIGLSGRTVKPKLIITCGISGTVQFTAAMREAECIIAISTDEKAPIFDCAHIGIVGDLYEVVPALIALLEKGERL